jgi:hypothetical protein
MRLLGKDIPTAALMERIQDRLRLRGLELEPSGPIRLDSVEARVDPLAFNIAALEEHADPTRPMGGGRGRVVLRWAFHKAFHFFVDETLARQRVFNGHVRDAYAQLSAEVVSLRKELNGLKAPPPEKAPRPPRSGAPKGV